MYLAPLNYDRFFGRAFNDLNIAKAFLQAILNVTIETIELLPRKNQITDDAAFIEFDFRCKINGKFVIVDMQQWYKPDVVKRFFMYFCNNTSLQLENMPLMMIRGRNGKFYKTKDYSVLEPSITIIWMADDVLGFDDDIAAFSVLPEGLHDFIRNEALWATNNLSDLLAERKKVLEKLDNKTKGLDFLRENRLIYALQPNIAKKEQFTAECDIWFDFAQRTKNKNNKESDFESFKKIPIFMDLMEKLKVTTLSQDDFQYIKDMDEYERGLAVYDDKKYRETWQEAMLKYEPILAFAKQEMQQQKQKAEQAEQETQQQKQRAEQAEQDKQKAEQDKQKAEEKAEQARIAQQILTIRKLLKRGDSVEDIVEFLEIDMPTIEGLLEQIKVEDTEIA